MKPTTLRRPPTTFAERQAAQEAHAAMLAEHGLPAGVENMTEDELNKLADETAIRNSAIWADAMARANKRAGRTLTAENDPTEHDAEDRINARNEAWAIIDDDAREARMIAAGKMGQAGRALTAEQLANAAERLARARATEEVRPSTLPALIPHPMPTVRPSALPTTAKITQVEGFENYTPDDLITPRIKVIQPMTRDAKPEDVGKLIDTLTGQVTPTAALVFLRWNVTRAKFETGNFTATGLQCASDDGRIPVYRIAEPFAHACAECPMSKWTVDGEHPPCREGRTFLALNIADNNSPVTFTCAGSALKEARRLITTLGFRGKPLYHYVVRIATEFRQTDKGRWYQPRLVADPIVDEEIIATYRAMYGALRALQITVDTETLNETDIYDV